MRLLLLMHANCWLSLTSQTLSGPQRRSLPVQYPIGAAAETERVGLAHVAQP